MDKLNKAVRLSQEILSLKEALESKKKELGALFGQTVRKRYRKRAGYKRRWTPEARKRHGERMKIAHAKRRDKHNLSV